MNDDVVSVDDYSKARRQESSHAACAAMRLAGISVSPEQVIATAKRAAGRYSDLSIMDALTDYFSAQNVPAYCEHGVLEGDWCDDCNQDYKRARKENGDE